MSNFTHTSKIFALILTIAPLFTATSAAAATHCTGVEQTKCTTANMCRWKKGHTAGTPTKSNPKKMYKRDSKASCRKDNKAINVFLIKKFNNLSTTSN